MHPFNMPQCTIQRRNVHISVLNGAKWRTAVLNGALGDMGEMHYGICETGRSSLAKKKLSLSQVNEDCRTESRRYL